MFSYKSSTQLILSGLCILVSLAFAPTAQAEDPAADTGNLVGYVKFPPLKKFTENISNTVRAVQPGMSTEILFMQFVAYGYPTFPGVSDTDGFTIFIVDDSKSESQSLVLLAKIAEDSPLLKALSATKTPWSAMKRIDEWVLLSDKNESLAEISDISKWIDINSEPVEHDIELKLYTQLVGRHLMDLKMVVLYQLGVPFGGTPDPDLKDFLLLLDMVAERISDLDWLSLSIDLSPETITGTMELKVKAGSPEAEYLAAESGKSVSIAKYLPGQVSIAAAGSFDKSAALKYIEFFKKRCAEASKDKSKQPLGVYFDAVSKMISTLDGTHASVVDVKNGQPSVMAISGGSFTSESLLDIINVYYDGEESIMKKLSNIAKAGGTSSEFFVDANNFEHNSVKVIQTKVKVTIVEGGGEVEDPLLEELMDIDRKITTHEYFEYHAAHKGMYLQSSSPEDMKTLIDNIDGKNELSSSIANLIAPEKGVMSQVRMNLPQFLLANVESFMPGAAANAKVMLEKLSLESDPVTIKAKNHEDSLELVMDVPVKAMMDVTAVVSGLAAQQQQQQKQAAEAAEANETK